MTGQEFKQKYPNGTLYNTPFAVQDRNGEVIFMLEDDCAERRGPQHNPGATLWLPFGDIGGFRNLQAGRKTDQVGDLNLDMGAGSADDRGIVGSNYDIGRGFDDFDGRKRMIFRGRGFDDPSKNYLQAGAPLRLDKGLLVKTSSGYRKVDL